MEISEEDWLAHYGTLHKSGRYPWMSGGTAEERNRTFLGTIENLKTEQHMSDKEIAKFMGLSSTEFRALKSNANNAEKQAKINMAQGLKDKGWSNVAIGKRMGIPESTVRTMLVAGALDKTKVLDSTATVLREAVAEKKYIDVGSGVEQHLGVSATKLDNTVKLLVSEGYTLHPVKVEQLGTGQLTTMKILAAPDTPYSEVYKNRYDIGLPLSYSEDAGRTYDKVQPPLSLDLKRVDVRYAEQGGTDADGVIYVRPGKKDLSLGNSRYAQVRIAVGGTHYLKGMAIYKDDLPDGVDVQFNTNKSDTGNKLDAMKPMKSDPTNPFGSIVRQIGEPGPDGNKKLTSVMNLVNEEGNWDEWSKTLSSQMLSKQSKKLAKDQLDAAYDRQKEEFEELKTLEDPAVKKKLLDTFAEGADSASVHLKAAALPRTQNRVILPVNSLKPTEVYAPQFRDGEQVVLIRHPHGGRFEIPQLTVNNRNPEAKKLLGDAQDAIGIHSDVAKKLSGADFDGDTVLVIPNNHKEIKTEPMLEGLKNFDPQHEYPKYDGMPLMDAETKGNEMGQISNLITDMTLRGAPNSELVRAIRHSMVVIDAEKHKLNYKQSAIDNGISALKERYQRIPGKAGTGAATIISRASARIDVNERKQGFKVDPVTGKKIYTETGKTYLKTTENEKTGKTTVKEVAKTERSKKLAETDDAHTLSSGTPIEEIYADHSNRLKKLANQARLESLRTKTTPYSPEARVKYKSEVERLEAALNVSLANSPLERQAQIIANGNLAKKRAANPDMDKAEYKKLRFIELENARARVNAGKKQIVISPQEWEAIRAGAITNTRLKQILNNADLDQVKELATPKTKKMLSDNNLSRAIDMLRNGQTQAEVADALGVSVSTLKRSLRGGDS